MPEQLFTEKPPKVKALTEDELFDRLKVRLGEVAGNGAAYAVIGHVRNAAGFDASRTIDAYSMALWPSRGLELIAYEMKSSRSDWVREMGKPEKAEAFCDLADRFYLVVGDASIVQPGELPATWGLMVPHGKRLKVVTEAPALRDLSPIPGTRTRPLPPAFGRSFLAALLRSATAIGAATPEEIRTAVTEATERAQLLQEAEVQSWRARAENAEATIREFEQALGVPLKYEGQPAWARGKDPKEVAVALRAVLEGDEKTAEFTRRVKHLRDQASGIVDAIEQVLGEAA